MAVTRSEEIAAFESRLVRVETKLNVVLTGTVMIIIGMVTLIARTFVD